LTIHLVCPTGVVSEHGNSFANIFIESLLIRLAIVPSINCGEYVSVLLAKITQFP
jgi:hypothetical protein